MTSPKREYTLFELQAHLLALLDKKIPRHRLATCRMCAAITEIGRKALQESRQPKRRDAMKKVGALALLFVLLTGCGGGGGEPCTTHMSGFVNGVPLMYQTGDCPPATPSPANHAAVSEQGYVFQFDQAVLDYMGGAR